MGMRVGGSNAAWATQGTSVNNLQQRQQNFKALNSALQTGDLTAAQQAFSTITANNPNAATNSSSPLAQIGQALQAGNLAGAQQAAQAWRGNHHEGSGAASNSNASTAVNTFLQTLTPMASSSASSSAGTSTGGAGSVASSDQIAQALAAFEKNLFDSLQAQGTSANSANTTSSTAAADPGTTAAPSTQVASSATGTPAPAEGHHHHHHSGGGAGGAQLASELSALIAQTSPTGTATTAATTASIAAAGSTNLDQSFKNLLSTLGVTGNNASLNSFLQVMSTNMQGSGTASSTPTTTA